MRGGEGALRLLKQSRGSLIVDARYRRIHDGPLPCLLGQQGGGGACVDMRNGILWCRSPAHPPCQLLPPVAHRSLLDEIALTVSHMRGGLGGLLDRAHTLHARPNRRQAHAGRSDSARRARAREEAVQRPMNAWTATPTVIRRPRQAAWRWRAPVRRPRCRRRRPRRGVLHVPDAET